MEEFNSLVEDSLLGEVRIDEGIKEENHLITEEDIIPKEGIYLGLDISEESTGLCLYNYGKKTTMNISLLEEWKALSNNQFKETLIRGCLKRDLLEFLSYCDVVSKDLTIIIEDVFCGKNAKTVRLLYSLNTAIDELILENKVKCSNFMRIQNGVWKSWLFILDKEKLWKGYSDKVKIQECLRMIGIEEEGEGFQDRLDATGMLIGYFLNKDKVDKQSPTKVKWSDIEIMYDVDTSFIFSDKEWLRDLNIITYDMKKPTKEKVLEKINENPLKLFVSKEPILLGNFGVKNNLPFVSEEGGYLVFYIKKSRRDKFKEKEMS